MKIGILSDTHGELRDRVLELLAGCDRILHAGDVGAPGILERLGEIAPVQAVRGNVDQGELQRLPGTIEGELDELRFAMVHCREDIPQEWLRRARLIVFGHTHRPEIEWRRGCLLLNPGSCGQARFDLPLTVARVTVRGERMIPELVAVE